MLNNVAKIKRVQRNAKTVTAGPSYIRKTSILSNLNNFHSLEVVDRVMETKL